MSKSKAKRARLQQAAAASGASVQAQSFGSKKAKKSEYVGKPSRLQDINCDVFFEIVRYLQPMDLLNLSRVSNHLRQMLMGKSVQWLWSIARSNVKPHAVPDPPRHVSEPRLASILFEMNCYNCRKKGIHDHIDYGIGVRFCKPCWDANIKSGVTLTGMLEAQDLPRPLIYQLNIRETRQNKTERADNLDSDKYHQPQFEAVVNTYKRLKDGDAETLQGFVTERLGMVKGAREANTRFLKWYGKVKEEERKRLHQVANQRLASIKQKLYDLGYTDEDFPAFQWDTKLWNSWNNTMKLPKELTDKAWCDVRPQLERIIQEYRDYILHDTSKQATDRRIAKRTAELRQQYKQFIDGRNPDDGPYPTLRRLKAHDDIIGLLTKDHGKVAIDRAHFDTHIVPLVEKLKAQDLQAMIDAARAHYTKAGEDMTQISEDDSMKLLHRATSLFKDPFGFQDDRFYGFVTLMERIRSQHIFCETSWDFYSNTPTSEKHKLGSATAAGILKMLGLPPDTPYEAVSKKVVCTCGRPGFKQPAEFSELVNHIDYEWGFCKALRRSRHESSDINLCASDHDINGSDVFVKLLENDEAPPVFSADTRLCKKILAKSSGWCFHCKVCVELVTGGVHTFSSVRWGRALVLFRDLDPEELVWHISYKHKRPVTVEDVFTPRQESGDEDDDEEDDDDEDEDDNDNDNEDEDDDEDEDEHEGESEDEGSG